MSGSVSQSLASELLAAPDVVELSEEEAHNLKERQAGLDKLLNEEGLAKYKLEVMFSSRRTSRGLSPGLLTWWESGNKLHGGGDSKMYRCDNSVQGSKYEGRGCGGCIPDSANGLTHVVCPHCQTLWDPQFLVGELYLNLPIEKWAFVLHREFMRLEGRADIYLKYGRLSIKEAQNKEEERGLRGELLTRARSVENRSMAIYPLKNILKDTANGAVLEGRILAFLKS